MADPDQKRRMLAALLSMQGTHSPLLNALARAGNPPPANALRRPSALANALSKPLPMEGRFNLLPVIESQPGMGPSVFNQRKLALPGILAGAVNAFTLPGRAMQGQPTSDREAVDFGMTFMGGGLLGSRVAPLPR